MASDIGGFQFQINDNIDGFLVELDIKNISQKLLSIINMDRDLKSSISKNGYELVSSKFNLDDIYFDFIQNTIR